MYKRRLACGPPSKSKVVAHLPPLFTLTDKHGNSMTTDERRWKFRVPAWCQAASSFRPSTNQFAAASDRIADINFHAYQRSKKYRRKQEAGYEHYKSTEPPKAKPMYHPLSGHKPSPLMSSHSEPSIAFTTSWLEPVVDEKILDDQFEQHMKQHSPVVRTLLRTNRKNQKEWDNKLDDHRKNIGGKERRNRKKPQKWIPRTDPTVKLPNVEAWLNRHAQMEQSSKVKNETSEAIKNNPNKRRKKKINGAKGEKIKKHGSKVKSHFLGSGSKDNIGWIQDKEPTEHEKLQLERLKKLERNHYKDKPIHSKKFNKYSSSSHSHHKIPSTFVSVQCSGIITGGVRFISKVPRVDPPVGRRRNTAAHYVSPLLLPHERN
jgi:hypothetical protein